MGSHLPDFMTHIRQELTLAPVRQLCSLSRSGILLDRVSQMIQHIVDMRLQTVHLTYRREEEKESVHGSQQQTHKEERKKLGEY
jgi:hypothetical protein